jgi:uncharacterized coiled-coil DUF342 family protein
MFGGLPDFGNMAKQIEEFQRLFTQVVATMKEMRDEVKATRAELAEARKEIAALKGDK